eukprot:919325-Rhodomonas_salina.1
MKAAVPAQFRAALKRSLAVDATNVAADEILAGALQQLLKAKKQRLDNKIVKAVASMPPAYSYAFQLCTSLKPLLAAALFLSDSVIKEQELCVPVDSAYLHKFTVNLNLNLAFQAIKEHLQELHVRHILFPKRSKAVINSTRFDEVLEYLGSGMSDQTKKDWKKMLD